LDDLEEGGARVFTYDDIFNQDFGSDEEVVDDVETAQQQEEGCYSQFFLNLALI
jgi:hypothetical protein